MKKMTALLLALMMLAGVLAGCGKPKDAGKAGKLKVVTTIFPAYDWVRAILGDKAENAEITMLLDNGVDLHSYQPTADDKIFAVTFDESFARATGTKAGLYNLLIAVVVAVIIVLAMNLVGSLLISALVIFPALSAMRMFKSFRSVTICAAVLSVFCALLGILASILAGTPVGSTIVAVQIGAFGLSWLAGTVLGGVRR